MGKIKKKENPTIEDGKSNTRERIADALELPKEIVLNLPRIILLGNKSVVIQNYKGVFLFEDDTVKINTGSGIVAVHGRKLKIIEINTDDLCVEGRIKGVEFLN